MFLGIDIGTSGVKVVLVDEDDNVVDQAAAALTVEQPKPLWSEQDPASWWAAANKAVADLDPKPRAAVTAIGLSGQMHGATLLDSDGQALRNAILWNDGRSMAECQAIAAAKADFARITGNLAMPGFTAPKLLWVREHEPEIFAKTAKVLLPKDYVRLRMTGEYASDMSDAAGTLWLDVGERRWSEEMLDICGLTTGHMPKLFEGSEPTGVLRAELAEAWGMNRVPVAAGGGDNAVGAVGSGVIRSGEAFLSLGTSGVVFVADTQYRPNPESAVHTFCHALPGLWHQMSVMLSAASAIDWVAANTGFDSPAALYAAAEQANTISDQTLFLPYLSGERTPHNDPLAKGAFFGLSHTSSPVSMAQAALEGVGMALADGIDAILASGRDIKTLSVIGGGARSKYWGKVLASIFNRPLIYRQDAAIGPAFGAARLARLATGDESIEDICKAPKINAIVEPDDRWAGHFHARRPVFRALYENTKNILQEND